MPETELDAPRAPEEKPAEPKPSMNPLASNPDQAKAAEDQKGYKPANPGPDNLRKPVADETQNEDHHGRIRELAQELRNASPSGANSISDKILFHLDAIADPKAYNDKMAADKKAEDEAEKIRAEERAKLKTKPADAEKAKEKA